MSNSRDVYLYRFPVTVVLEAHSKKEAERNLDDFIRIENLGFAINDHCLTLEKGLYRWICECLKDSRMMHALEQGIKT